MKSRTSSIGLAGAILFCVINIASAFATNNHAMAEPRLNDQIFRGHRKTRASDIAPVSAVVLDTLLYQDWESGIGNWWVDNGVWEVGVPTVGPDSTTSGQNCAGTNLSGNYMSTASARLVSPHIMLPSLQPGERIWFKFWHWFRIAAGDYGYVQISVNGGAWQIIGGPYTGISPVWTQVYIDLSAYADSTVRIAFYFTTDDSVEDLGWYIDDIVIIKGAPTPFNNPEDFEQGIDDWWADNGLWEVGPGNAYSDSMCAGTVLRGVYPSFANTRLVSPEIILDSLLPGERIRLRFWHWFSTENENDVGHVQISCDGGGSWTTIAGPYEGESVVWTRACADLSAYADSTVLIAFYFTSNSTGGQTGWYIDDVYIDVGLDSFPNPEDFESGVGDWCVDNGVWEVGIPTVGPDNAYSDSMCAATVLGGNYPSNANTSLISPEITLTPEDPTNPNIGLYFWHWFRIVDGDYGWLQISVEGGSWQTLAGPYSGLSPYWSQAYVELSAYADSTVRIAFYFTSDWSEEDLGWYIDDVRIWPINGVSEYVLGTNTRSVDLYQNHPNPFRPTTQINYTLPRDCDVKLEVFNSLGQKVATLVDQKESAGYKSVRWDASSFSAGIYFYRLQAGDFADMKKMVILK